MVDVAVIGAGLGGMAVAARLAKQRHRVTVFERNAVPGGAIGRIGVDGFSWDAGPASTALPAVLRDLFRKSGRPLERYVDLALRPVARRHRFADGSYVDLPTGSRGAQIDAVDAGLGPGAGLRWSEFVDAQAGVWEILRREILDDPLGGGRWSDRSVAKQLHSSTSLERLLKKAFKDERLRLMAAHGYVAAGSQTRDVPAFGAVDSYVERSFGVWSCPGGMAAVGDALATRLSERGVDLRCGTAVTSIRLESEHAAGVELASGENVPADVVVADIDPRQVFERLLPPGSAPVAARAYGTSTPAVPPAVIHLGIEGDVPALPDEVVLHGDPALVLLTMGGQGPPGTHAWTVYHRGNTAEDVLFSLARRGIDVRDQVVARLDRSPADIVRETGGSAFGTAWDGWRAHARRAAHTNPMDGLYLVGSAVHPGASIPYVGWGAAHVAHLIHERST